MGLVYLGKVTTNLYALNRGEVSELALARTDNEALRLAAEVQENWLPRVLGPMMLRPGTEYVGGIYHNAKCKLIPFVFSGTDTALIELTENVARFWVKDKLVTRAAVATTLENFRMSDWDQVDPLNATVTVDGILQISNVCQKSTASATRVMEVVVADHDTEHALRIIVDLGPIEFRIGSSRGDQDIFQSQQLGAGIYSIAFTPGGRVYIQFSVTDTLAMRQVSFIGLEPAGELNLPTTFVEDDLPNISFDQSADVVFIACDGQSPSKFSRYSKRGWGFGPYLSTAGPFPAEDGGNGDELTPSDTHGSIEVTSSRPFFRGTMVGQQLRLFHDSSQRVLATIVEKGSFTPAIRVSGVAESQAAVPVGDRGFFITITGSWTGTISLQRSLTSATEGFALVTTGGGLGTPTVWTANVSVAQVLDDLQNVICWYRVGVISTNSITGTANILVHYPQGAGFGYGRITKVNNSQSANVEVLKIFATRGEPASSFRLSEWSTVLGWPSVVAFHEGRLWFASGGRIFGSVSDQFYSFDDAVIGDSGEIDRSIGAGPITHIRWLLSSYRLQIGGDTSVQSCRSDSLDTPLTPTNFTLRPVSTNGAAPMAPGKIDLRAMYVEQSGRRIYQVGYAQYTNLEQITDLTRLNPDIGVPGFTEMAVMTQPDPRLYLRRNDGQMVVVLNEADEQINALIRLVTDGAFENVVALPGILETRIYVCVKRQIGTDVVRYLERFSRVDECQGGTINKNIDCHGVYKGVATTVITGLEFLNGKDVVVWGDGKDIGGPFRVADGAITLPVPVSQAVVGLGYTATFRSAKLAFGAMPPNTAVNQVKRVDHIGMLLANTHCQAIRYGADADTMSDMPLIERGAVVDPDTIHKEYDERAIEFPGNYDTDSRIHVTAAAPRPATIMGFTVGITTSG